MLDPGLEHLHRHGRSWRASNQRLRLIKQTFTDALLIPAALALYLLAPEGTWAPAWVIVILIGVFVIASLVRFEIGSGSTSPLQLVLLPLWFSVPPGWLTIMMAIGLVIGGLVEHVRDGGEDPLWRRFLNAGDAWPAVGPAIVLSLAGAPAASLDVAGVAAAAFAAQMIFDWGVGVSVAWYWHGIRPRMQVRLLTWITAVDASLAPIGFLAAVVMATEPLAILALVPLVAIIGEFARERTERLEQALQLSSAYRGTAQLMGDVLEADDAYTGGEHTQGVVDMAVAVGLELRLEPRVMRDLEFGALLHDIGKLRVPNEIINKPGALNADEWQIIRRHPEYGQEMLDRVGGALTDAGRIVRAHHERWDGMGYPDRLRGDEIPLAARIITVCDSFSAMTTQRSYSRAMDFDAGVEEVRRCSGTQFDPAVVDALCAVLVRDPALGVVGSKSVTKAASPVAAALGLRSLA